MTTERLPFNGETVAVPVDLRIVACPVLGCDWTRTETPPRFDDVPSWRSPPSLDEVIAHSTHHALVRQAQENESAVRAHMEIHAALDWMRTVQHLNDQLAQRPEPAG